MATKILPQRPRRNRVTPGIRDLASENLVLPQHLIQPIFLHCHSTSVVATDLPGIFSYSIMNPVELLKYVNLLLNSGIKGVILFAKVDSGLKCTYGLESSNSNGTLQNGIRLLRQEFPELVIFSDVALDPYTHAGHDGVLGDDGIILNDVTLNQLEKQAISHAEAGVTMVAPSDMMDGRVEAIRSALDSKGFTNVGIMSYTAKYASSLYSPFRKTLSSWSSEEIRHSPSDKKTYQMDYRNSLEAMREAELDINEGADILMVKPGILYLDIVSKLREKTNLPISVYNVSGEYMMVKRASENDNISEKDAVLEILTAFRRAGANFIVTYHGYDAAKWIQSELAYN